MFNQLSQQLSTFWKNQSKAQRTVLIILVVTGLVLVPLFLTWANTPTYAVAFSGLDEADAGLIVQKLDEAQIPYQLRDSGTILVPSKQVYDVRLKMATQGLPQGGTVGFELFNGNTLGMTEFTQRVNYQQAMEGELERTIGSLNAVQAVRVHIVTPEKTLLSGDQAPTTASVTIKEKAGTKLDASQVSSITHLVASSVEGLKPENVVVVDVNGNMLASGEASGDASDLAQSDSHRNAEMLAARELQSKVQNLLDSALGPNKSVVQASVTMDWTERQKKTQSFAPDPAAIRSSTQVTETYTTTNGILAGIPGATSNLPPAANSTGSGNQAVNYLRTEATNNYEITQTESQEVEAPGKIQRIALSVLVDGVDDQTKLTALQSAIGAAAGIDQTRGDLLSVQTLAFDRSYYQTEAGEMAQEQKTGQYFQIGEAVAAALILLALLWYVQRLLKNLRLASAEAWTPVLKPVSEMALPSPLSMGQLQGAGNRSSYALDPASQKPEFQLFSQSQHQPEPRLPSLPKYEPPVLSEEDEQLQTMIQQLAEEDPSSLASIIQIWLSEDEKGNG
jgi:flagellar M-ring protein FliF